MTSKLQTLAVAAQATSALNSLTGNAEESTLSIANLNPLGMCHPAAHQDILRTDEETAAEMRVGTMRLWLDLVPEGDYYSVAKLQAFSKEFEVRVTIWDVSGISIY
jgi:hypothetical protein